MTSRNNNNKFPVALGLGSNLGDKKENLNQAIYYLKSEILEQVHYSKMLSTKPVDCPPCSNDFLNIALTGWTVLSPHDLLIKCQEIEEKLGRPQKHGHHENRTIDIDILLYSNSVINSSRLTIPHPGLKNRYFVLLLLAEIAPDWAIYPEMKTVLDYCRGLNVPKE